MKTPPSPSPSNAPSPLGPFTTLRGGGLGTFAAGIRSTPIVELHRTSARWWTGDSPTTVSFDDAGPVAGAVWLDGGKRLRVGLGTLDLEAKTFAIEPALQPFAAERKRLAGAAWFPDGTRVALLIIPPALRVDQRPPKDYDRTKRELVIVSLAGSDPPVRRAARVRSDGPTAPR